jgi:predicted cupin superfamily sugar epimerase
MATDKKKKEVKVRDLKPAKDAKGGFARQTNRAGQANRGPGQANRGTRNIS